ncbi:MAG TPA: hypothetical protein VIN59_02565 [Alphaproteobacteria bacterium]
MMRIFALTFAVLLAFAGGSAHATDVPAAQPVVPAPPATLAPAPSTGVPQGASGADVPFTNDGANRPVLETLTPAGQAIPIDPAVADQLHAQGTEGHGAEAGHKKGLPQFDVTTFAKQIFWLVIVFVVLYIVNAKKILPTISAVIENRRERIASDLRAAEDLKNQIAKVRGEYEAAVAAAQAQAQQVIVDLQTEIKKQGEIQDADFKDKSERAIEDLEARLDIARTRITSELGAIAADVTRDIAKSVAGLTVDASAAERAVNAIQGKKEAA